MTSKHDKHETQARLEHNFNIQLSNFHFLHLSHIYIYIYKNLMHAKRQIRKQFLTIQPNTQAQNTRINPLTKQTQRLHAHFMRFVKFRS